jgi:hypothetical protein
MKRVYLDQNKWIELARAASGQATASATSCLAECRKALADGRASFPLDLERYFETSKPNSARWRNDVSRVMAELSRFDGLTLPKLILPMEIDLALQKRAGLPLEPRYVSVFGRGIAHISGGSVTTPSVPTELSVEAGTNLGSAWQENAEYLVLATPPEELWSDQFRQTREALRRMHHAGRYLAHETGLGRTLREHGWGAGERLSHAIAESDFVDIKPVLAEAMWRAGIPPEDFQLVIPRGGIPGFIDDLPTRAVTCAMRRARHSQPQQRWTLTDLVDITSLPPAVVYCDVVVTERQWAQRLTADGTAKRFGTAVIPELAELTKILQAPTAGN